MAVIKQRVIPGFGLTMGFSLFYLSVIFIIPVAGLLLYTSMMSWEDFWKAVSHPQVVASYKLSFGASLIGATINLVFGGLVAWVLVRYHFPGKRFIDALVDLPFALPTAVAGIALVTLYVPPLAGSVSTFRLPESRWRTRNSVL